MTPFQEGVIEAVNKIPFGNVVSYGQVALYLDMPRAARAVGWVLRSLETNDLPWWRVINNSGRITIKGNRFNSPEDQKRLLQSEGVLVTDLFEIDIDTYRFQLGFR